MQEFIRATGAVENVAIVGNDRDALAHFYRNAETGKDHLKLTFPGDKTFTWDQPVRESDKANYPQAWAAYEAGLEKFHGQTRLEEWAVTSQNEGTRLHLNANGIYTVEQVAGILDGMLDGLGPNSGELRRKAQEFMAEKDKARQFEPMQQQVDAQAREMAEMREEIARLKAVKETVVPETKRGPGRPKGSKNKPKEEAA